MKDQLKESVDKKPKKKKELDGNFDVMYTTGSTELDLAMSGLRIRGGGAASGILIEISGPESSGKTVLVCEAGAYAQAKGSTLHFLDPEGRLDKQFASSLGVDTSNFEYGETSTVHTTFKYVRDILEDRPDERHCFLVDSLAALSTEKEIEEDGLTKMPTKVAMAMNQELRLTIKMLKKTNSIMICNNQLRDNVGVVFGSKDKTSGGRALPHWASIRLRTSTPKKISKTKKVNGVSHKEVVGEEVNVKVIKNSTWVKNRTARLFLMQGYGIDDVRANLQYIKDNTKNTIYKVGNKELDKSLEKSIAIIEDENLEKKLKDEVIDLWEKIQKEFIVERKPKKR